VHHQIDLELAHLLPLHLPVALRRRSSTRVGPGRSSCQPFGLPFVDSMISPVRLLWLAASAVGRQAGYTQRRVAWAIDLPFRFSPVLSIDPIRGSGARVPQMRFAQPSGPDWCSLVICRYGPHTRRGMANKNDVHFPVLYAPPPSDIFIVFCKT
jgi:hypothetical protein